MPYATSLPMAMDVRQMVKTIETAIALTGLYVALISRMVPRVSAAKERLTRPNRDGPAKATR